MDLHTHGAAAPIDRLHSELIRFAKSIHLLKQPISGVLPHSGSAPLLARLTTDGPQRSRQLAEHFSLDPSTVSRQVDQLVKAGLLRRTIDPDDGRAQLLEITEQGVAALNQHRAAVTELLHHVLDGWSAEDLTQFADLLARLNNDTATQLPTLMDRARRGERHPDPRTMQEKIA